MNKNSFFYGIVAVLLLFTTACSNDDDTLSSKGKDRGKLISVIKSERYTPDEFMDAVTPAEQFKNLHELAPDLHPLVETSMRVKFAPRLLALDALFMLEVGSGNNNRRQWQMESYVFTYMSKSCDGADTEFSGRVTFPNNTVAGVGHEVESLSLFTHPAIPGKAWVPSENLDIMMLRSFFNSAVIEPDLQGYGVDEGKHKFSQYAPKVTMLQLADCVTAALEVMRQHDVKLAPEGYAENWGGSQTAATTAHFQKYYETDAPGWFRKAVRLRSSFIVTNIRNYADAEPMYLTVPESRCSEAFRDIIVGVTCLKPSQRGGYEMSDFMSNRALTEMLEVDGKKMTAYQYMTRITGYPNITNLSGPISDWSLTDLAAPDMLTPDGKMDMSSPKVKALVDAFHLINDYGDFNPKLPIYLCQHKEDEYFTQEDLISYAAMISDNGKNPNVHCANIPLKTTNSIVYNTIGIQYNHFVSYLLAMYYEVTSPTTADAFEKVTK